MGYLLLGWNKSWSEETVFFLRKTPGDRDSLLHTCQHDKQWLGPL